MKKVNLMKITLMCLITNFVFAQWTHKTINSEFDGSFKKAYTETNNNGYLIMEFGETIYNDNGNKINAPFLGLIGLYFCDDNAKIEFVFTVDGVNKKYELDGIKSTNSKMYFFSEYVWTDEFIKDFKSASKCLIRVNQTYCEDEYYKFNFSGSTSAYNFITN
jgi:hypothetical protein